MTDSSKAERLMTLAAELGIALEPWQRHQLANLIDAGRPDGPWPDAVVIRLDIRNVKRHDGSPVIWTVDQRVTQHLWQQATGGPAPIIRHTLNQFANEFQSAIERGSL